MSGSRNFCQFYLVLSLFYSLKRGSNGFIAEKTILIPTKDPEAVHYFPGRGGGVQMLISIETHILVIFQGECKDRLSPCGSAHGQCHHNGTIFITVRPLTIIVRH